MAETTPTSEPRRLSRAIRIIKAITGPWTRNNALSWIALITLLLLFKGCIIDQYTIPSGSMEPTLHGGSFFGGDRVLVNKWLWGPRIPFTHIRLMNWAEPKRWDIVVFHTPEGGSEHPTLVKRIVGLPGERVRIWDGKLEINGQFELFPDGMPENMRYWNDHDLQVLSDRVGPGPQRDGLEALRKKYPYRYGVFPDENFSLVPEGHYLVLGDNSLESVDGRVWGWVPRDHLLGPAFAIWWPFTRWRDFSGFSKTWWGMILLYGTPLLIAAGELQHFIRQRRQRNRREG